MFVRCGHRKGGCEYWDEWENSEGDKEAGKDFVRQIPKVGQEDLK